MFVKVIEKRQFPGFRFFRRGGIGAWQGQEAVLQKKYKAIHVGGSTVGDL